MNSLSDKCSNTSAFMNLKNIEKVLKKYWQRYVRVIIYNHRREVDDMGNLLKRIKKALAPRKSEQELRQIHNREQVKLILQGLEQRGC